MKKLRKPRKRPPTPKTPEERWLESERLFRDFKELTPYTFRPFVKSFTSFQEYENWRRAQTNPWYR